VTFTMHLKGETPKKYRYEEHGGQINIGGLYVCKTTFGDKPAPKTILVSIREVVED
jgi:hypothetical protein